MFFIFSLLVLFVLLPLSISAGNRIKKGVPLNKAQLHLFVHRDFFQTTLGKHYQLFWWIGWLLGVFIALLNGFWLSAVVFTVYMWSRLRFQKLMARPATAVDGVSAV